MNGYESGKRGGHPGDATGELLAEMHRNVTMGAESLAMVIPGIRAEQLMTSVTGQMEQYADFTRQTEKLMRMRAEEPKQPNLLKKAATKGGIMMNRLLDPSEKNICDMIAKGTRTGAEQLQDKMEELEARGCAEEVSELCRDILSFEEEEIVRAEKWRAFLSGKAKNGKKTAVFGRFAPFRDENCPPTSCGSADNMV